MSLIITSCLVALMLGMSVTDIVAAIEKEIGSQLGHLALVFGFGAMLGRLVADAGGGYRIAATLITTFGKKNTQIAVVAASFTVGIALFFEVGLILLPIILCHCSGIENALSLLGYPYGRSPERNTWISSASSGIDHDLFGLSGRSRARVAVGNCCRDSNHVGMRSTV